jgi:hypothetical protein
MARIQLNRVWVTRPNEGRLTLVVVALVVALAGAACGGGNDGGAGGNDGIESGGTGTGGSGTGGTGSGGTGSGGTGNGRGSGSSPTRARPWFVRFLPPIGDETVSGELITALQFLEDGRCREVVEAAAGGNDSGWGERRYRLIVLAGAHACLGDRQAAKAALAQSEAQAWGETDADIRQWICTLDRQVRWYLFLPERACDIAVRESSSSTSETTTPSSSSDSTSSSSDSTSSSSDSTSSSSDSTSSSSDSTP